MTADAWNYAKDMVEKHAASGGIFVKLQKDGDHVCGCFVGEPHVREVIWTGEHYEAFVDGNPKHKGKRPTLRLAINFYIPAGEEGEPAALKVIEFSSMAVKDLLKLRDKYGFGTWKFEVERQGGPNDPKTKYRILPDDKIDTELRAELAQLELHDLKALLSGDDDDDDDDEPAPAKRSAANDATIDEATAKELMTQLKTVPREQVDVFLKRFGVGRIRDVKARDEKAAFAFIESVKPGAQPEVDPWA
jgi:hypothetical protein